MARVRYIPTGRQEMLDRYYQQQGSGGLYFAGPSYQRGHGLGGLFGRLFRAAVPIFRHSVAPVLKKAGKELAKEALTTGVGVANDMLAGENFKDSARARLNTAANRMTKRGVKALEKMMDPPKPKRRPAARRGRKSIKGGDILG